MLPTGISLTRADGQPPAEEMTAVHEASATLAYAHIFDAPFPVEVARHKWAAHPGEVWLARRGQQLVGFATRAGAELDGLFVLPEEAGSGIGTALLTALPGVRRLWVLEDACATRLWYEKRGWRPAGDRQEAFGVWELLYVR